MPRKFRPKLPRIRAEQRAIERKTVKGLAPFRLLDRLDSWQQLLLDRHAFAVNHHGKATGELRSFLEVFVSLSSMALANVEAARTLVLRGFYGNALGILRTLTSQNNLLQDLVRSRASVRRWLELREIGIDDRSKESNLKREYFMDKQVEKRLSGAGIEPLSLDLMRIGTEAVHGTPRGSVFYMSEDLERPGSLSAAFEPQRHPTRYLQELVMLLSTMPNLCGPFLNKLKGHFGRDDEFDLLISRFFLLGDTYAIELAKYEILFAHFFGKVEERLRAGEDFDEVLKDMMGKDPSEFLDG